MILAVDDEPLILNAYQRNLGDRFTIFTSEGPAFALSALKAGSFAVVLTDLKMPGMDGIALLQAVKELQPNAVRLLISGHADLNDAINSVNRAGIFRLLLKPCPLDELTFALDAAIAQYRLITAEKSLLEETLNGSIQALTDILGILDGEAFGQAQLRRQLARQVATALKQPSWEFEMSALLSEIGRATLPPLLNEKLKRHDPLSEVEVRLVERIPEFSHRLLSNIPRIESVARAVLYQNKNADGTGFPGDYVLPDEIPLPSHTLHALNAFMALCAKGSSPLEAIATLKLGPERYNKSVVAALPTCVPLMLKQPQQKGEPGPKQVSMAGLMPGMILRSDIKTRDGIVVLAADAQLSGAHIQRIKNFSQLNAIQEPILVEIRY